MTTTFCLFLSLSSQLFCCVSHTHISLHPSFLIWPSPCFVSPLFSLLPLTMRPCRNSLSVNGANSYYASSSPDIHGISGGDKHSKHSGTRLFGKKGGLFSRKSWSQRRHVSLSLYAHFCYHFLTWPTHSHFHSSFSLHTFLHFHWQLFVVSTLYLLLYWPTIYLQVLRLLQCSSYLCHYGSVCFFYPTKPIQLFFTFFAFDSTWTCGLRKI